MNEQVCIVPYIDLLRAFSYEEGALVTECCAENTQKAEKVKHFKRSSEFVPSAKVGSRLPHMLVRAHSSSSEVYTLDA
jgi:hypothetical protein